MLELNPFKIRDYFPDQEDYKLLTTFPSESFLKSLERLAPLYHEDVSGCLNDLYSYITQRNFQEGSNTFYIHIASTVAYEVHHNTHIKEKDHAKKAVSILKRIFNCLNKHTEYAPESDDDLALVEQVESLLVHHAHLINRILALVDDKIIDHLKTHCAYNPDEILDWKISTPEKRENRSIIHAGPSPLKTPQKLSLEDRKASGLLRKRSLLETFEKVADGEAQEHDAEQEELHKAHFYSSSSEEASQDEELDELNEWLTPFAPFAKTKAERSGSSSDSSSASSPDSSPNLSLKERNKKPF